MIEFLIANELCIDICNKLMEETQSYLSLAKRILEGDAVDFPIQSGSPHDRTLALKIISTKTEAFSSLRLFADVSVVDNPFIE